MSRWWCSWLVARGRVGSRTVGDWTRIELEDGRRVWVQKQTVTAAYEASEASVNHQRNI